MTVTVTFTETNCDIAAPTIETPKVTTEGSTIHAPTATTIEVVPTVTQVTTEMTLSTTSVESTTTHTSESKTEKATDATSTIAPPVPTNGVGHVDAGILPIAAAIAMALLNLF